MFADDIFGGKRETRALYLCAACEEMLAAGPLVLVTETVVRKFRNHVKLPLRQFTERENLAAVP